MRRHNCRRARRSSPCETGAALVLVLLGIFILMAIGVFIVLALDRNTDLRSAFQRNVAGFAAAEAGLNVGAAQVLTAMQGFSLPTNCTPQSFALNGRTVTYTLSVPGNAPGDCTPRTTVETLTMGRYAQLNAIVHQYNLTSTARNMLGYTEASISNQFHANLIPVFQFAAFYKNDLEILPSPPMDINGRVHTNGDLYLNSDSCGGPITGGLNILGQIDIVGNLYRGRKDSSQAWNNVYISLDGTPGNMQVLGAAGPGDIGCAGGGTRQVMQSEWQSFNQRISVGVSGITLPNVDSLLCTPWDVAACGGAGGVYWQNANLRIVLDTTQTGAIVQNGSNYEYDTNNCMGQPNPPGPCLYPIRIVNADGSVNDPLTSALLQFMQTHPGALTYTDVPIATPNWDCYGVDANCESDAYNNAGAYSRTDYAPSFPTAGMRYERNQTCTRTRLPRDQIRPDGSNYCDDYRYGGFYNWREKRPILMLNIDWMALDEYNRNNGNVFFDPNTTTNGGVVVFLSVKGAKSAGGNNYGVRLYDAARLPRDDTNSGISFAMDTAAYVTGNFNCPAVDTSGGDAVPAACGPAKRPSSIVADTINVLSCAWIDPIACGGPGGGGYQTGADYWAPGSPNGCGGGCRPRDESSTTSGDPNALETVINAAFLAGNDTTVGGLYSGGLENYPRFHEDWGSTGQRFWYQGSFVSLDVPRHSCFAVVEMGATDDSDFSCNTYGVGVQGFWGATRYNPPPRRWFYDVSYNNSTNLPPLTPRFVDLDLVYFTQVFQ
jgi:hypothetical protein